MEASPINGNGNERAAVLWIGGLLITGMLSGAGTWAVNYVKEAHDAAIRADRNADVLEARMQRVEAWRIEIQDLASKRGEIIPRMQRDIDDLRQELRWARERHR